MESLEASGKTVEEAIEHGLEQLGLKREEVEVTVLKKGRTGLLGIGAEEARVTIIPLTEKAGAPGQVAAGGDAEVASLAADCLKKLLEGMEIGAAVEVGVPEALEGERPSRAIILEVKNIQGDDLGMLIGRRGQTLISLQYIVRLMVAHHLKSKIPVTIDIEGYSTRRTEALKSLARDMAERVQRTKRPITLEPMPASERRIIHLTLAEEKGVTTESIGEGESRKVVISPGESSSGVPAGDEGG